MTDLSSSPATSLASNPLPADPIHAVLVDEVRLLQDFHTKNIRLISVLRSNGVFVPIFEDTNRYLVISRKQNTGKPKSWQSAHRALLWLAEHIFLFLLELVFLGSIATLGYGSLILPCLCTDSFSMQMAVGRLPWPAR